MNGKTLIGIGLTALAMMGFVCAGGMLLLGLGKRLLPSEPSPPVVQSRPERAVPIAARLNKPIEPEERIPIATREPAQLGDVQVWVVSVCQIDGGDGKPWTLPNRTEKAPLFVRVRLVNKSQARKLDYVSWQKRFRGRYPHLADEHGNIYRSADMGILHDDEYGHIQSASSGPGEWFDDVLTFEGPLDQVQTLSMQLGGDAIGQSGIIRFVIPRSVIRLVPLSHFRQKR